MKQVKKNTGCRIYIEYLLHLIEKSNSLVITVPIIEKFLYKTKAWGIRGKQIYKLNSIPGELSVLKTVTNPSNPDASFLYSFL